MHIRSWHLHCPESECFLKFYALDSNSFFTLVFVKVTSEELSHLTCNWGTVCHSGYSLCTQMLATLCFVPLIFLCVLVFHSFGFYRFMGWCKRFPVIILQNCLWLGWLFSIPIIFQMVLPSPKCDMRHHWGYWLGSQWICKQFHRKCLPCQACPSNMTSQKHGKWFSIYLGGCFLPLVKFGNMLHMGPEHF